MNFLTRILILMSFFSFISNVSADAEPLEIYTLKPFSVTEFYFMKETDETGDTGYYADAAERLLTRDGIELEHMYDAAIVKYGDDQTLDENFEGRAGYIIYNGQDKPEVVWDLYLSDELVHTLEKHLKIKTFEHIELRNEPSVVFFYLPDPQKHDQFPDDVIEFSHMAKALFEKNNIPFNELLQMSSRHFKFVYANDQVLEEELRDKPGFVVYNGKDKPEVFWGMVISEQMEKRIEDVFKFKREK